LQKRSTFSPNKDHQPTHVILLLAVDLFDFAVRLWPTTSNLLTKSLHPSIAWYFLFHINPFLSFNFYSLFIHSNRCQIVDQTKLEPALPSSLKFRSLYCLINFLHFVSFSCDCICCSFNYRYSEINNNWILFHVLAFRLFSNVITVRSWFLLVCFDVWDFFVFLMFWSFN